MEAELESNPMLITHRKREDEFMAKGGRSERRLWLLPCTLCLAKERLPAQRWRQVQVRLQVEDPEDANQANSGQRP